MTLTLDGTGVFTGGLRAAGLRVPTGTPAGTRLGTGAPTLSVTPGHIESIGALAELLPP